MTTILGVTGHRPPKLGGYSAEAQGLLFLFAMGWLESSRPDHLISGIALGWDAATAEACVALNIPFTAAVPFDGQESRWPQASILVYRRLLQSADKVVCVNPGPYAPWKMQARNEWVVDQSARMAAIWDGTKGGTANCVAYIEKQQKPWENLWPKWQDFSLQKLSVENGS